MNTKIGLDDQTELLNSRPPVGDQVEDTRESLPKYLEWERRQKLALGLREWQDDVAVSNTTLKASLAKIAAAGAPSPVVDRVAAWSPVGVTEQDVYIFFRPENVGLQFRAGEKLLTTISQLGNSCTANIATSTPHLITFTAPHP